MQMPGSWEYRQRSPWHGVLDAFDTPGPELIAQRALGHRCDTKFLLSAQQALSVLERLSRDYVVLTAAGERLATYRTLYFDTPSLASYHAHRRGRRIRHKMRIRHYLDRRLSTLEVKSRHTEYLSIKSARPHPFLSDKLTEDDATFIAAHSALVEPLSPQVHTHFRRITLLNRTRLERVTFDLDLTIERDTTTCRFDGAVIAEVKQWPFSRSTPAMRALQHGGPGPVSLSKYCAAVALTLPREPHHRFLPGLRRLAAYTG